MIGLLEYVKIGSERVKASLNLNVLEQTIDLSVTRAYFILCVAGVEWSSVEKVKMAREFSPPCPPFCAFHVDWCLLGSHRNLLGFLALLVCENCFKVIAIVKCSPHVPQRTPIQFPDRENKVGELDCSDRFAFVDWKDRDQLFEQSFCVLRILVNCFGYLVFPDALLV